MFDEYTFSTVANDGHLVSPVVALTGDAPSLLFSRKYADVAALSAGDHELLRPIVDPSTAEQVRSMAPPADEIALVFGANGFVGAHLVAELSLRPGITTVYAGVRSAGDSSAAERFEETVAQYSITGIDLAKIVVIEAVPTRTNFGLDEDTYLRLRGTVDQVFNSASSTDYDSSYLELRQDWFVSLLRVVQFTLEDRRKHLTYMGSIGAFIYTSPEDFLRPDSWWYSGYCQMKWINGQLLGWLARDGVASVTLVESPYVLGSTTVGKDPGRVYSFWRAIELANSVGAMWDGPGMNYAPVDVLARVLADNALGDGTLPTSCRPIRCPTATPSWHRLSAWTSCRGRSSRRSSTARSRRRRRRPCSGPTSTTSSAVPTHRRSCRRPSTDPRGITMRSSRCTCRSSGSATRRRADPDWSPREQKRTDTRRPRSCTMSRVPPQPMFLETGARYRVRVFLGDFVNFTLGLVYYVACATLGVLAVAIDAVLRTHLYDAFVALVERIDHGKETAVEPS